MSYNSEWPAGSAGLSPSLRLHPTANGFVNTIIGDLGKNVIDGKGGADPMQGMAGDDNYQVDNPADKVIEAVSAGIEPFRP